MLVLPMGMCQLSDYAQAAVEEVFHDMLDQVLVYMDDLKFQHLEWRDHIVTIKEVLSRLLKAGFTVNPAKCEWAVKWQTAFAFIATLYSVASSSTATAEHIKVSWLLTHLHYSLYPWFQSLAPFLCCSSFSLHCSVLSHLETEIVHAEAFDFLDATMGGEACMIVLFCLGCFFLCALCLSSACVPGWQNVGLGGPTLLTLGSLSCSVFDDQLSQKSFAVKLFHGAI
jgi:hypothetical protein